MCSHTPPRALQHQTLPPSQGGVRGNHVSSGSGSRLLDREGSSVATCLVATNLAYTIGKASVSPRVQ
jgi:hypothetical protein